MIVHADGVIARESISDARAAVDEAIPLFETYDEAHVVLCRWRDDGVEGLDDAQIVVVKITCEATELKW
jgi:hypothetical protein